MSNTGLSTFDRTLHESNAWLNSLMGHLHSDDRHFAYITLRATFHALRDRVGPENASHFAAQLPMLLRGLYYEGWHIAGTPTREATKQQFLDHVREELPKPIQRDAERAARAVFEVVWERMDAGAVAKTIQVLPEDLKDLWPRVAHRH